MWCQVWGFKYLSLKLEAPLSDLKHRDANRGMAYTYSRTCLRVLSHQRPHCPCLQCLTGDPQIVENDMAAARRWVKPQRVAFTAW